jgi:hypothetical protein
MPCLPSCILLLAMPFALLGADPALASSARPGALAGAVTGESASASELAVELCAPLTTLARVAGPLRGEDALISARVLVPADAPADIGVGAFVVDRHGRWFQSVHGTPLQRGLNLVRIAVGAGAALMSEPGRCAWGPAEAATASSGGLFFWSASASRCTLRIFGLQAQPEVVGLAGATAPALLELEPAGVAAGADGLSSHGRTGERWNVQLRPQPFPGNPFDADEFALDCRITASDGTAVEVPGFYQQEMSAHDRGDREELVAAGSGRFAVRYRPREPGRYRLQLVGRWRGGRTVTVALPDLVVSGPHWDGYARVDAADHRFFAVDGAFFWPLGPNLRSVNDTRGRDHLNTVFTPDRGTIAYDSYLARLQRNRVNCIEVWMSSWNLALEWRGDWPGFYGQGRYSMENAWRLDRILDLAYQRGIRINLVVNNHGQASADSDREWPSNPYNRERGGELASAAEFFTAPYALAGQERLRRYLVARYADHPAVLGWKLWSEVNLTAGSAEDLRSWHQQAAARWHALDIYGHGVTSHWCGDYHAPDRAIVALPGLDYVCIDAYHGPDHLLADLLYSSTLDPVPGRGLAQFGKPVLTTEFGCNWDAGPEPQLLAEHASGPWAAMVSGHAGSPMLWWLEWLDQRNRFQPYLALSGFLAGEDLRGKDARTIVLGVSCAGTQLWSRAWSRPGRMLGYVLDPGWGASGAGLGLMEGAAIRIGGSISAGPMTVEWWDADAAAWHRSETINHRGGELILTPPPFERHIAFKLYRPAKGG